MPGTENLERYTRTEGGLPVVSLEAWARSVEGAEPARAERGEQSAALIREAVPVLMRAVDTVAKTITIVAGTSGVDRYRDRIMVAGYDDAQFRRNPIMPWCHEYWALPVAQGVNPRIEGDGYVLEASFADTSRIYPFAAMVWEMYAAKVLRMASVGGMPTTWVMDETRRGMDVTGFDLWEVSLCPLGVNPDAMAKAKLNGIDAAPLDAWAREVADAGGCMVLSKPRAEALVKALGYGKGLALFELEPEAIEALRAVTPPPGEVQRGPDVEPKKKPRTGSEDGEPAADEPEPEEKAEAEPAAEDRCPEAEDDLVEIEMAEEDEPATAEEDEIEVDEAEMRAAVEAVVSRHLAQIVTKEPLRVEAR